MTDADDTPTAPLVSPMFDGEKVVEVVEPRELPAVRPDVAPGPDEDAGGAGDEVYLAPALALVTHGALAVPPVRISAYRQREAAAWAAGPSFRAAIDAARAPLLAELAEANARAERFQLGPAANRAFRAANVELRNLRAELAEAIRERDEARAKTGGGEWVTEYGHNGREWWLDRRPQDTMRRRAWTGEPEPITDDGGAG